MIARARAELQAPALFLAGKSMGGRIASMLAARGEPAAGLVLLGYPLQPAGRPEVLRSEHLPRIKCPMLFVQGSRDRLCDLGLLRGVMAGLSGDHSFKVPKRSGRTERMVWEEIVETVASWLVQSASARASHAR